MTTNTRRARKFVAVVSIGSKTRVEGAWEIVCRENIQTDGPVDYPAALPCENRFASPLPFDTRHKSTSMRRHPTADLGRQNPCFEWIERINSHDGKRQHEAQFERRISLLARAPWSLLAFPLSRSCLPL